MIHTRSTNGQMRNFYLGYLLILMIFILFGCNAAPTQNTSTPSATTSPTPSRTTTKPPADTATPPPTATQPTPLPTDLVSIPLENIHSDQPVSLSPQPWAKIHKDKVTLYTPNLLYDFAYAKDGELWIVGSFGVIHRSANGKRNWYSMKNGLPINKFKSIGISPTGQVWIGGSNLTLFRYNGTNWVDESSSLPAPLYHTWLCRSEDIVSIDFDQNGAPWVLTSAYELYTLPVDHWISVPLFEKIGSTDLGTPGCNHPIMSVSSATDITIRIPGCCSVGPTYRRYDGSNWTAPTDGSEIEARRALRHTPPGASTPKSPAAEDYNWISSLSATTLLPATFAYEASRGARPYTISMATDQNKALWIIGTEYTFSNTTGTFQPYQQYNHLSRPDAEAKNSNLLNFGSQAVYFQKDRRELYMWEVLQPYSTINNRGPLFQYPSVDKKNRVWLYYAEEGLAMLDSGKLFRLAKPNPSLDSEDVGGVLPLSDGRVMVGSVGAVWTYDGKNWQKWPMPGQNELLLALVQDSQGIIYAASTTSVYKIDLQNKNFDTTIFVPQNTKPTDTKYNRYSLNMFSIANDDSIYYANNKLVARFDGQQWHSVLFDKIEIEAATLDTDQFVWLYADKNGLIKLAPNAISQEIIQ